MPKTHIKHHQLSLKINPDKRLLIGDDILSLKQLQETVTFYLGHQFTVEAVSQAALPLSFKCINEGKHINQYEVKGLNIDQPKLRIKWHGKMDTFGGYGVTIIKKDMLELSGFGFYFPTLEKQCQLERFTYHVTVDLPDDWTVLCPESPHTATFSTKKRVFTYKDRPIEDILICASPTFKRVDINGFYLVLPKLTKSEEAGMIKDFKDATQCLLETFGPINATFTTTGLVSPRGKGAQEWGYERGDMWVIGDLFLTYAVQNDFIIQGLKKSLSMHEMIHSWFGIGVDLTNQMAEAITQYCEVVLTEVIYNIPNLAEAYFNSYEKRLLETPHLNTDAICDLTVLDNHYNHWYLKGAHAFYELENTIGRASLLEAFKILYKTHVGQTLTDKTVMKTLGQTLDMDLSGFYAHWFKTPGFTPYLK